jgi:CBS domain containing-hemolysin-like protein
MIAALIILVLALGLAAGAATVAVATAAVSQVELTRWVAYRLRGVGGATGLLENPSRVLATANAITTVGTVVAAAAIPAMLAPATPTVLGVLSVLVGVPLVVSMAYLVPRVVGRRWAGPIAARAVPWVERVAQPLAPFIPRHETSPRTTLAAVVSGADTEALAHTDEMAVVQAVLGFAERPVRDLMTPRTGIVALPEGTLAAEAAHVCAQTGYSRYPVYRGSLDEVVGVAHAIDFLGLQPDSPIPARPALAVPGTTHASVLMRDMQRGRGHLAVVLDEFGGTAGVVSLEDLLKNLVSEIFGEGTPEVQGTPAQVLELEGNTPSEQLDAKLGVSLGGTRAQTVGGLLVQALGRIPRPGERFLLRGLEFEVLGASSTRIERILVQAGPVRAVPLDTREPT